MSKRAKRRSRKYLYRNIFKGFFNPRKKSRRLGRKQRFNPTQKALYKKWYAEAMRRIADCMALPLKTKLDYMGISRKLVPSVESLSD